VFVVLMSGWRGIGRGRFTGIGNRSLLFSRSGSLSGSAARRLPKATRILFGRDASRGPGPEALRSHASHPHRVLVFEGPHRVMRLFLTVYTNEDPNLPPASTPPFQVPFSSASPAGHRGRQSERLKGVEPKVAGVKRKQMDGAQRSQSAVTMQKKGHATGQKRRRGIVAVHAGRVVVLLILKPGPFGEVKERQKNGGMRIPLSPFLCPDSEKGNATFRAPILRLKPQLLFSPPAAPSNPVTSPA